MSATLAEKIKAQRVKKGLNKTQLADMVEVTPTAIGQFEKGANFPKTEVLLKLSKILDYDFVNAADDDNILSEPAHGYNEKISWAVKGIPMYNIPGSASLIEMYGDANDVKIVGYLNIPGATKDSDLPPPRPTCTIRMRCLAISRISCIGFKINRLRGFKSCLSIAYLLSIFNYYRVFRGGIHSIHNHGKVYLAALNQEAQRL